MGRRPNNSEGKTILPGIGDTTHYQLTTLLSAASSMIPFVLEGAVRVGPEMEKPAMDGGVAMAAASSCIRVFSRIDEILDDPRRWSVDGVIANQEVVSEAVKTQKKLLEAQLAHVQRPSTRLSPKLGRTPAGTWVAVLETPDPSFAPIFGTGQDPESALADFDRSFKSIMGVMEAVARQPEPKQSAEPGSSDPGPPDPMERLHRTADETPKKNRRPRKDAGNDSKE
jgi:hypothetical protein